MCRSPIAGLPPRFFWLALRAVQAAPKLGASRVYSVPSVRCSCFGIQELGKFQWMVSVERTSFLKIKKSKKEKENTSLLQMTITKKKKE